MNGNPSQAQRDWHTFLIDHGCAIQGSMSDGRLSLHHLRGSKFKLKGVKKPGEWLCLCLSYWWHQDGRNPAARHVNKSRFEREVGSEIELFIKKVELYQSIYGKKPMLEAEYKIMVERA